ncbi:MAG: MOP flippase family protein [Parvibaculum sp.]|nr:MOP flippase family protein [Parvibaculum sp.]
MQTSFKKKSLSAVMWSGASMFMRQGLQFVVAIVLARLLSPEEFGTFALLYLFTGIAFTLVEGGFSSALVQQAEVSQTDESTVFWINLFMGILLTLLLWIIAPWIASFYEVPVLVTLARVLAFTVLIDALGSVHRAILGKKLEFKVFLKVSVYASVFGAIVAITMAMKGYGLWALAAQMVTTSVITTILLWHYSGWRPTWEFSFDAAKKLFSFGGFLMLAGLLDVAYTRIYTLLIGKLYGVRDLGFYSRADNTKQIPVDILSHTLASATFPIFAAAAHDKEKVRRGLQLSVRGAMLINIPVMLGLLATSTHVVTVLFGEKWLPSVPLLQILCLVGLLWPLHVLNLNVLKALGHSRLFFNLEIIKKIIGIAMLLAAIPYGMLGIAWSQVIFGAVSFWINAFYTKRYIGYGFISQIRDFLPVLIVSLTMAYAVYWIGEHMQNSSFWILPLQVITGVIIFIVLCIMFRIKSFHIARDLLLHRYS